MTKAPTKERLNALVDRLIEDGKLVLNTAQASQATVRVDLMFFTQWRTQCLHLLEFLGTAGGPWQDSFPDSRHPFLAEEWQVMRGIGALRSIKEVASTDLLVGIEDLVFSEAFADLLEQADHLFERGYTLAAGVLARAVLEEHLRKWCDRAACAPKKKRPTIEHYKQALYAGQHINKLTMKNVDDIAAIGNAAAHRDPEPNKADVERLLRGVREFLERHPIGAPSAGP